ncbi:MAG TPA: hypothetical protein VL284_02870 [Thermoanaerobaculia bacterium]|nr:hypothetical protein [Thermoanaerobaculia bacterium]
MHNLIAVFLLATAASSNPSVSLTAPVNPRFVQKRDAIGAKLTPSAKLKLHAIAMSMQSSNAITDGTSRSAILSTFGPNLGNADIEALAFFTLMEASDSAAQDLKSIMDDVQKINDQKSALRRDLSQSNSQKTTTAPSVPMAHVRASAMTFTVPPPLASNATLQQKQDRLDQLDDMSEALQMKLQEAESRKQKFEALLSNLEKNVTTTGSAVLSNLK